MAFLSQYNSLKVLSLSVGFAREDAELDGSALLMKARVYKILGEDDLSKKLLERYFLKSEPNHPGYVEAARLEASFERNLSKHLQVLSRRANMVLGFNPDASADAYMLLYGSQSIMNDRGALSSVRKALVNVPFKGEDEYVVMMDICFLLAYFGHVEMAMERAKDVEEMFPNAFSSFLPDTPISKLLYSWKEKKKCIETLQRRPNNLKALESLLEISLVEQNLPAVEDLCGRVDKLQVKGNKTILELKELAESFVHSWKGKNEEEGAIEGRIFSIREPVERIQLFVDYIRGDLDEVLSGCSDQIDLFLSKSRDERDINDMQSVYLLKGIALQSLDRRQEAIDFWEKAVGEDITNERHKNKILAALNELKIK